MILASPVGAYYAEGINPVKIYVEPKYVRSVRGGVGFAKTVGNYAASMKAQMEAKEKNYAQVLWLDALEKKYVEEVGTMNVFFVIGDEVITPSLEGGSILPGITRDSVITLLKSWGINVRERKLSIEEIFNASKNNTLKEAFGTGTAAVISPIGELFYNGDKITINNMLTGEISSKIYKTITSMQYGLIEDPFEWIYELK
jgi:branched-chain amino acid aminotransferase